MARIIPISVADKIATAPSDAVIVCDNSDYIAEFEFDAEWADFDVKTARFCFNGAYLNEIFTGNSIKIPRIYGALYVEIGVFAGDIRTTTPARVRCMRSILSANGNVAAPSEDVYSQIMARLNEGGVAEETDPTVSDWAKQPTKPEYTAAEVGAYTKDETDRAIQLAVNNGGIPADSSGILLIDRTTGKQYVLYVEDGKLSMDEKIAEIVAAICGMTLCGQTVCGG